MKKKELKILARKIAKIEQKLRNTEDPKQKKRLEAEIIELSGQVDSLEDMVIVDEMVLEILGKI